MVDLFLTVVTAPIITLLHCALWLMGGWVEMGPLRPSLHRGSGRKFWLFVWEELGYSIQFDKL